MCLCVSVCLYLYPCVYLYVYVQRVFRYVCVHICISVCVWEGVQWFPTFDHENMSVRGGLRSSLKTPIQTSHPESPGFIYRDPSQPFLKEKAAPGDGRRTEEGAKGGTRPFIIQQPLTSHYSPRYFYNLSVNKKILYYL